MRARAATKKLFLENSFLVDYFLKIFKNCLKTKKKQDKTPFFDLL